MRYVVSLGVLGLAGWIVYYLFRPRSSSAELADARREPSPPPPPAENVTPSTGAAATPTPPPPAASVQVATSTATSVSPPGDVMLTPLGPPADHPVEPPKSTTSARATYLEPLGPPVSSTAPDAPKPPTDLAPIYAPLGGGVVEIGAITQDEQIVGGGVVTAVSAPSYVPPPPVNLTPGAISSGSSAPKPYVAPKPPAYSY